LQQKWRRKLLMPSRAEQRQLLDRAGCTLVAGAKL